ncbi:CLUMA_CG007631, isoform A [Clunio marinus]|uniref:CLUMA_CG007631, isoform A n=1 Tax=Clunio marinus TaxID=568069 RepID=A0A1J1I3E0_9DIPT|nr:CLUMA_CG007631, isoform A [Clunio marinus]
MIYELPRRRTVMEISFNKKEKLERKLYQLLAHNTNVVSLNVTNMDQSTEDFKGGSRVFSSSQASQTMMNN